MKQGKKERKAISEAGWMPFWWGSKFNRRLISKRERQEMKRIVDELCDVGEIYPITTEDIEAAIKIANNSLYINSERELNE